MGKAIYLLFLLLISPAVYAQTTHTVGGNSGWDSSVNYGDWAKGQTFAVGDSLLFNYGFTHAVNEVNENDYTNCNTGSPISSDANSPTTITLSAAGITRYFICPRSNHCNQGMKLAVTVAGGTPSPPSGTPSPPSGGPSPPSGGAAPSPPSGGSTPPTTSTPSSPPPPNGNAATTVGGGKSLMVGVSVVLGALLGVMG